jgi:hypothetical protein
MTRSQDQEQNVLDFAKHKPCITCYGSEKFSENLSKFLLSSWARDKGTIQSFFPLNSNYLIFSSTCCKYNSNLELSFDMPAYTYDIRFHSRNQAHDGVLATLTCRL